MDYKEPLSKGLRPLMDGLAGFYSKLLYDLNVSCECGTDVHMNGMFHIESRFETNKAYTCKAQCSGCGEYPSAEILVTQNTQGIRAHIKTKELMEYLGLD